MKKSVKKPTLLWMIIVGVAMIITSLTLIFIGVNIPEVLFRPWYPTIIGVMTILFLLAEREFYICMAIRRKFWKQLRSLKSYKERSEFKNYWSDRNMNGYKYIKNWKHEFNSELDCAPPADSFEEKVHHHKLLGETCPKSSGIEDDINNLISSEFLSDIIIVYSILPNSSVRLVNKRISKTGFDSVLEYCHLNEKYFGGIIKSKILSSFSCLGRAINHLKKMSSDKKSFDKFDIFLSRIILDLEDSNISKDKIRAKIYHAPVSATKVALAGLI